MKDGNQNTSSSTEGDDLSQSEMDLLTQLGAQASQPSLLTLFGTPLHLGWRIVSVTRDEHNCLATVTLKPPARSIPTQEPPC